MSGETHQISSPRKAKTSVKFSSRLYGSVNKKDMPQIPETRVIDKITFQFLPPDALRKMSVARVITPDLYDEEGLPLAGGLLDPKFGPTTPGERCPTCGNSEGTCPGHFGHVELARPVVRLDLAHHLLFTLQLTCWQCHRFILTEDSDPNHPWRVREFLALGKDVQDEFCQNKGEYCTIQGAARQLVLGGNAGGALIRRKLWKIYVGQMGIHPHNAGKEHGAHVDLDDVSEKPYITCPHCHVTHSNFWLEGPTTFYAEETGKGSRLLTPAEIQDHLTKIPDIDCWALGINPGTARPEWMFIQALPVPPTCLRPSITLEDGTRSEDDLTRKLADIVKVNQRLGENLDAGAPPLIIDDLWELLQYHVTTYLNNEIAGVPPARHRSGQALKTWAQRLEGKEGHIRHNLSGKRVNSCARTVISPAPHLSINQVGVPRRIAMALTVPDRVTAWNLEAMQQLVINGPRKHPGASHLLRADGRRISLAFVKNRVILAGKLQRGFVVERHLQDGDIVLFNRQPSLHRMSIMAHVVVVVPGKTFRVPVAACTPYNADFDGDEMNLYVPQGEEARGEARHLLEVKHHLISPRNGETIMGCIQDHVSMAYLLTRHDAYFTRAQTCQLLYHGNVFVRNPGIQLGRDLKPRRIHPLELYWGKDIFSMILPKGIYIVGRSKFCLKCKPCLEVDCPFDAYVVVRDGQLLRGVVDKATLGPLQPTSLLGKITLEYGHSRGQQFLDDVSQMLLAMLPEVGFTMGLDDVTVTGNALQQIRDTLESVDTKAKELIQAHYGKDERVLPPVPGLTTKETLEVALANHLGKGRDIAGEIVAEALGNEAHSVIITRSGARGNPLNLAQMAACVGQQSVRGARIHRGYATRTLPHFREGDLSPAAHGFVKSSYQKGLNPIEFYFHAMGGREGLVDTAARTSTSGYLQRRLVNALQDLTVAQDRTVRDAAGNIVQFIYGDDGIDPAKSDHGYPVDLDGLLLMAQGIVGPKANPPVEPKNVEVVTNILARAFEEKNLPRILPPKEITPELRQIIFRTTPDLQHPVLKQVALSHKWRPFLLQKKVTQKLESLRAYLVETE